MSDPGEVFDHSRRPTRSGLDQPDARRGEWAADRSAPIAAVRALTAEGCELEELDRSEDALEVFRRVIVEFGHASEPELREQVAFALLRTGLILCFIHQRAEAIAALGALLKSFADDESEAIADHLAVARERYQKLTYGSWR
jgi:hypothetical protein